MKEFSIVHKGYDRDEVDRYVAQLESALENKSRQLAEFQKKESAINNSIIEAQLTAEKIRRDATLNAADVRRNALNEMSDMRDQLTEMHSRVEAFQAEYNRILQEYLVSLRSNELGNLFDELETFMDSLNPDKVKPQDDYSEPASVEASEPVEDEPSYNEDHEEE